MKDNKKDWLMVSKYDIGDKVYSRAKQSMVEIKGIIFSVHQKGYTIQYTTKTNEILAEADLLDSKPLLDDYEKRFLRHLVVSLKITKIRKVHLKRTNFEWLDFQVNDRWYSLPYFKKGSMYIGLDSTKEYNIKDLDLEEKIYKY